MRKKLLLAVCAAGVISPVQMSFAQDAIPDEFSSVSLESSNAYEFAKACMPTMSESSFNQSIRDAGEKKTVVAWPADRTKPYLAITKGKAYCVNMSAQKKPVLPLAVFEKTIEFPRMAKEDVIKLRTDLSKQLARVGIASALVVNEAGNAYQIAYLLASDTPNKFFYQAGFLKKGEFDEKQFSSVYKADGGMSISARGESAENYKFFF